jgi:hypothetical protein
MIKCSMYKHSSLLNPILINEEKHFITLRLGLAGFRGGNPIHGGDGNPSSVIVEVIARQGS